MKPIKSLVAGISCLALLGLAAGCKNDSPSAPLEKSGTVLMKAAAKVQPAVTLADIPVKGGSLNIQSALLNIEKFRIEENSGFDGEQEGEHNDDDNGKDNEHEAPDITAVGPFGIDISKGEALLDSVAVYAGTFKNINLTFARHAAAPFNGRSLVISGQFTPTNGAAVPLIIRSEFAREIQSQIAGNGITITDNARVPVVVSFDLQAWFNGVDFTGAQIANGQILIDNANNAGLLSAFETNLAKFVEAEEDHDGD